MIRSYQRFPKRTKSRVLPTPFIPKSVQANVDFYWHIYFYKYILLCLRWSLLLLLTLYRFFFFIPLSHRNFRSLLLSGNKHDQLIY